MEGKLKTIIDNRIQPGLTHFNQTKEGCSLVLHLQSLRGVQNIHTNSMNSGPAIVQCKGTEAENEGSENEGETRFNSSNSICSHL